MQLAQLTNWWHTWGEIVFLSANGVALVLMMVLSKMKENKIWFWITPMFAVITLIVVDLFYKAKPVNALVISSFIAGIAGLVLFLVFLIVKPWSEEQSFGGDFAPGMANFGGATQKSDEDFSPIGETISQAADDVAGEFGGEVEEEKTRVVKKTAPAFAWLVGMTGNIKGSRFDVKNEGVTTIGRSSKNDIVIGDDSVSREHAKIKYIEDEDKYKIYDLVSKNGTFVNGEQIEAPVFIEDGDEIEFGEVNLVFKRLKRRKIKKQRVEDEEE